LLVVAADKLHNLTAIERDLLAVGQDVWRRFNAEPPDQFWYYGSVVEILERGLKNPIVQCLKETLERVRIAYRGRGISKAAMPPTTPEAFQRFGTSLNRLILDLPDRESIVDTLDYLLGAYYGLSRAQELGFQDRTTGQIPSYSAYVANDALAIAAGKPPNQVSLAGFYFNSSIQRLAAAFERIPKMLGAKKANAAEKMKEVNSGDYSNWERVYREVNDFKHKPEGRAFGRGVTMADAVAAFEQTLALLTKGSTTLKARYR
jgi:hypothetical protein